MFSLDKLEYSRKPTWHVDTTWEYSFIQQIFRDLLFAKHCAKCWGFNSEHTMRIWDFFFLKVVNQFKNLISKLSPMGKKLKKQIHTCTSFSYNFKGVVENWTQLTYSDDIHSNPPIPLPKQWSNMLLYFVLLHLN